MTGVLLSFDTRDRAVPSIPQPQTSAPRKLPAVAIKAARLAQLSPLLAKCERLETRNQKLAAVIEGLVDDMLEELER